MLGLLLTLVFAKACVGLGRLLIGRWLGGLDAAAQFGVSGLVGLGAVGTLTLFIGLLPGGLHWGLGLIGLLSLVGLVAVTQAWRKKEITLSVPRDVRLLAVAVISIAMLFALVGVLAPSDSIDWDSLAYHMAVPKLWLAAGKIEFISYIHHSNFPFTVDNLYIWGLTWGGESGAKAFALAFALLGTVSIFGLARRQYGEKAGWWAALAFGTTPMVVWLSGTAYIDVANGLYGGLGIAMAALWLLKRETSYAVLSGILIGLCAASKYTGLQVLIATGLAMLAAGVVSRNLAAHFKAAITIGAIAVAISTPWYVKNVIQTGNPVYPFFYSMFGGKNWDAFSEQIYKDQQQTFGAGRSYEAGTDYVKNPLEPARLGHAVLGLAYQPGRYIDPNPIAGQGFIFGSLGFTAIAGALFWAFAGRAGSFEGGVLGAVGIGLLMWFALSEQSRYILGLTVPLCILLGGAIARLRLGIVLAVGCVVQAGLSLYAIKDRRLDGQLQVVTGKVSPTDYQTTLVHFYEPSQWINENVKGRIALYDEVFGYFLDIPYFWAGPGHTTEIGYDKLQSGQELAEKLRQMGITHAYIDLSMTYGGDHTARDRWAAAAGLGGPPQPYSPQEVADASKDIRNKYKVLLAQAIAGGQFKLIKSFGVRLIFEIP